jgi:MFS family permease
MSFPAQIWILACGRFLSAIGSGFTAFYAPIFFVNTVGLKASSIGFGLGAGSVVGMIGRVVSGAASDHSKIGRKRTMLLAMLVLATGSFVLSATTNFGMFICGAICAGFGIGLYWPATQAFVADVAEGAALNEAFGITFLCDFVGLSLGVVLGGLLISAHADYRLLFIADGISYLVFFMVVLVGLKEPPKETIQQANPWHGWETAVKDQRLKIFIGFNLLFTSYVTQIETTLPLFFKDFVHYKGTTGFPYTYICGLFAEYIILMSILQIPLTRRVGAFKRGTVLIAATTMMCAAFCAVWVSAITGSSDVVVAAAAIAMVLFAIAVVLYSPAASALVAEMAPQNARGVYLSINSLCWAAGGAIGAPLGLSALDWPSSIARHLWLGLAGSAFLALALLLLLNSKMTHTKTHTVGDC